MCLVLSLNLMILPRSNIGRTKFTTTLLPSGGQQPGLVYFSASLTSVSFIAKGLRRERWHMISPRKPFHLTEQFFFWEITLFEFNNHSGMDVCNIRGGRGASVGSKSMKSFVGTSSGKRRGRLLPWSWGCCSEPSLSYSRLPICLGKEPPGVLEMKRKKGLLERQTGALAWNLCANCAYH